MENKTGKYFKYAIGEIVLVVIGILIALQINNWNEERKTENIRQVYYKQLLKDFDIDKVYIEEFTLFIESNMVKYKAYKETYKQPNLPTIQILTNISNLNWNFKNVDFQSNTITSLQNTGDIKLIPPIIREHLISLRKYQELTESDSKINNGLGLESSLYARRFFGSEGFLLTNIINQPKLLEWVLEENRQIQIILALESSLNHKAGSELNNLESFKKILLDMDKITKLINEKLEK